MYLIRKAGFAHRAKEQGSRDFVLRSSPCIDFDEVTDSHCAPAIIREGTAASRASGG